MIKLNMAENKNQVGLPPLLVEAVQKGRVVFYGEFRRGLAMEFTAKAGKVYRQTKCTVETETGTITVSEFMPDNFDVSKYVPPFQKGQMVFCVCRGLEESSGVLVAQGKLFPAS